MEWYLVSGIGRASSLVLILPAGKLPDWLRSVGMSDKGHIFLTGSRRASPSAEKQASAVRWGSGLATRNRRYLLERLLISGVPSSRVTCSHYGNPYFAKSRPATAVCDSHRRPSCPQKLQVPAFIARVPATPPASGEARASPRRPGRCPSVSQASSQPATPASTWVHALFQCSGGGPLVPGGFFTP